MEPEPFPSPRRAKPIEAAARACRAALWTVRRAVLVWESSTSGAGDRHVAGWVEVMPGTAQRSGLRRAHVWLHGTPVWEFEFRDEGLPPAGAVLGGAVVFAGHSITPILVHTPIGRISPVTEPRIIDHPRLAAGQHAAV